MLWLGGDANLPEIDLKSDTINGNRYSTTINQLYTDTINDIGCEQMVDFPTRIDNTLDIFCINRPSLVDRCIPLPGLSNHDTVLVDCKVRFREWKNCTIYVAKTKVLISCTAQLLRS